MFERCLYFNLNTLARQVNRTWEQAFGALGLSPAHAYLLRLVVNEPGLSLGELAQRLGLAPSTVTRFVDALEERGYLSRAPTADDSRSLVVRPTRKAAGLAPALEQTGQELYARMVRTLGAGFMSALVKDLREARTALTD